MIIFLQNFGDFLQYFVPCAGLVFLLLRIYVLSRDTEVLRELRALRAEINEVKREVKKIKHERV